MGADSSERLVLLNRLADEFAERYRRGERPSLREYTDRHPELADDIREFFPALAEVEQAKEDHQELEAPPAAGPLPPLERLGDFRILREIGHGGMGVVYEAEQVSLGRHVALKVLPQKQLVDARTRRRFEREAKAAARLHHTNIVPVFGVGEHDGLPYYVMQFIQGLGLDEVLDELKHLQPAAGGSSARRPSGGELHVARREVSAADVARSLLTGAFVLPAPAADRTASLTGDPAAEQPGGPPTSSGRLSDTFGLSSSSAVLPGASGTAGRKPATYWQSVARIGVQVAEALEHAHKQGVLHRDVKPSNLLLDTGGTVWVTDFGLAKSDDKQDLTRTGDVLGTLRYMPPEAFEGRADARSDVYALGLTLYELLALRPAYPEQDRNRLIKEVTTSEPARLDRVRRDVPRDLVTVVHKAIERDPARRYATAGGLAADLQRFLEDEPILARRVSAPERYWRWARRNPGVAALGGVLTAVLVAGTAVSLVTAAHFKRQEQAQRELVREKSDLAESNERLAGEKEAETVKATRALGEAEAARRRAETVLIDMHTSRGLVAAERPDAAQAMLWFAQAARLARHDPERERFNRIRVRTWGREAVLPVAALPHGGRPLKLLEMRPGGPHLLTLTHDGHCYVWDWPGGEPLPWARGQRTVSAACWGPDGRWLVLGLPSGKVEIRSVPSGEVLHEWDHPGPVTAVAFSRDGKWLAVASKVVRLWNCRDKAFQAGGWEHPQPVHSLIFGPAGDRLATACLDQQVRVFAVRAGPRTPAPLFAPLPHTPGGGYAVAFTPPAFIDKGRGLLTITGPTQLTWWDARTGKPTGFGRFDARVAAGLPGVLASPDGDAFVFGSWRRDPNPDGTRLWSLAHADPAGTPLRHDNGVNGYAFSPDGKKLLTVSWDRTAKVWSVPDGKLLTHPIAHQTLVVHAAFSSDGRFFATADKDGLVRVWRWPVGNHALQSRPYGYHLVRWKASRDGRFAVPGRFLYPFSRDAGVVPRLRVYEIASGNPVGPELAVRGACVDATLSGDGKFAAAVSRQSGAGQLYVWEAKTGKSAFPPVPLPGPPLSLTVGPDDARLAVLCGGGQVVVVSPRDGRKLLQFRPEGWPQETNLASIQASPRGALLAVNAGGSLHLCDGETGATVGPPLRPDKPGQTFLDFAFSGDGRLLATTTVEGHAVQVWGLPAGGALSAPLSHPVTVFQACFSPDGRRLFTACADGQARLWDWRAGQLACAPGQLEREHWCVAVSADGRLGLTAFRSRSLPEGSIQVSEFLTGKPVTPALGGPAPSLSFVVSADGARALAHGDRDGRLFLVDLSDLARADDLSPDDLCTLAELIAGQRIYEGDLVGLSSEGWLARWRLFRQRCPQYLTRAVEERGQGPGVAGVAGPGGR